MIPVYLKGAYHLWPLGGMRVSPVVNCGAHMQFPIEGETGETVDILDLEIEEIRVGGLSYEFARGYGVLVCSPNNYEKLLRCPAFVEDRRTIDQRKYDRIKLNGRKASSRR